MDRQIVAALLIGLYGLIVAGWMLWSSPDDVGLVLVADLAPLPLGLAATAFAWRASRAETIASRTRRAWFFLALAFGAFFAGDLLWFGYENLLDQQNPFPSLADIGYLAYYPLILVGLLTLPRAAQSRAGPHPVRPRCRHDPRQAAGWSFGTWSWVRQPLKRGDDPLTMALSIGYPVGRPDPAVRRCRGVSATG